MGNQLGIHLRREPSQAKAIIFDGSNVTEIEEYFRKECDRFTTFHISENQLTVSNFDQEVYVDAGEVLFLENGDFNSLSFGFFKEIFCPAP